jgi:hypothetical protein
MMAISLLSLQFGAELAVTVLALILVMVCRWAAASAGRDSDDAATPPSPGGHIPANRPDEPEPVPIGRP